MKASYWKNKAKKISYAGGKKALSLPIVAALFIAILLISLSAISYAQEPKTKSVTLQITVFTKKTIDILVQPASKIALPGTEVTYTARINNLNPIPVVLNLASTIPDGWSITLQDSVNINAKSSTTVTFKVKSPSDAGIGSYEIGLSATSDFVSGSATAGYTVDFHGAPLVEIEPKAQTGVPGKTLSYNVKVTNNDMPGFDPSRIVLTPIVPAGWKGKLRAQDQEGLSVAFRLAPGESADAFLDVTSAQTARELATVGVNASANNRWSEGYAEYRITLCGDGVCDLDESSCSLDCGPETHFVCSKAGGRCEQEEDAGVSFGAGVDFQFTKFYICKKGSTLQQCTTGECGKDKSCLCSTVSSLLSNQGECDVRCVDTSGAYYLYAKGLSESATSIYNYSYSCPFVDLPGIKSLLDKFTTALNDYDKSRSALTEYLNKNPGEQSKSQPCLDAYTSVVADLNRHVKFLQGVYNYPAKSNTTEARARSEELKSSIESRIANFCVPGITGLLKIISISEPVPTEIRGEALGSVSIRNTGSIPYYGFAQCDFTKGTKKVVVNDSCMQINPQEGRTFVARAAVDSAGSWNMVCRAYGSLVSDCSSASVHDTSMTVNFTVFSKDVFVKDAPTFTCGTAIECKVRTSNNQRCSVCYIDDRPCNFVRQENDVSIFSCPYVAGNFTLRADVVQTSSCTPVEPVSKTATGRCSICGDEFVDAAKGEQCEPPGTENNPYVSQQSGLQCSGRKSAIRDEFGYCTPNCRASVDVLNYTCNKDVCGAECSDGETRIVTKTVNGRVCSYVQQCGSACVFNTGNCEPSDVSVVHSPQNPVEGQIVTIQAITRSAQPYTIEIYIDDILKETCASSPCTYNSTFEAGEHGYYSILKNANGTGRDPLNGTKKFTVRSASPVVQNNVKFTLIHEPVNPSIDKPVNITAETNASTVTKIEIFVDNTRKQLCDRSPCSFSSLYAAGTHTYYATLVGDNTTLRNPTAGTNTFVVSQTPSEACSAKIINATCTYNATKNRYYVNVTAAWTGPLAYHAHIDVEGDKRDRLVSKDISSVREMAGPGMKMVRVLVDDLNDSTICMDATQVLCGQGTTSADFSILRDVRSTVRTGITPMKIVLISNKDVADLRFVENVMKGLNVSSITVSGNSSAFAISPPAPVRINNTNYTAYTFSGKMNANENITIAYNVTISRDGNYNFSSRALYDGKEKGESKVVFATSCAQTNPVYAVNQKTGTCQLFSVSCDVPSGWNIVSNCPQQPQPEPGLDFGLIIMLVAIIVVIIFVFLMRHRIAEKLEDYRAEKMMKRFGG